MLKITKGLPSTMNIWECLKVQIVIAGNKRSRNPTLQVVIMYASHVCSQHSFGLPLGMSGMHMMQFDYVCLGFLSLIIRSHVF